MTKNLTFEFKHKKLLDETKFRIVFMDKDINIEIEEDPDHIHHIYDSLTQTLTFFSARSKHLIKLINFNASIIKDHGHQVEEEEEEDVMVSSVFSIPDTLPNQFLIDFLKNCVLADGHLNTHLQHLLLQYIFAPTEEEKELVLNALFEMVTLTISCCVFKNHEHAIKVLPIDDIINIINKDSMIFGKHIRRYLVNEIDGEKMFYIQPIKNI